MRSHDWSAESSGIRIPGSTATWLSISFGVQALGQHQSDLMPDKLGINLLDRRAGAQKNYWQAVPARAALYRSFFPVGGLR
jgi:predicted phage tail protein